MLRGPVSDAQCTLGNDNPLTLHLRSELADTLAYLGATDKSGGGIDNLRTALAMHDDVYKRTRQIFGAMHPMTQRRQRYLEGFRARVAQAEAALNP